MLTFCPNWCTNLISNQTAQGTLPLSSNPASDAGGSNLSWLCDHNVARGSFLTVVVQNELRQLSGLSTARGSTNDHNRVAFYEGNQLEAEHPDEHSQNERG